MRSGTGWMDGFYGLPSGKTEHNESYISCAIREAKEEIGVEVKPEDIVHAITVHRFSVEKDKSNMIWADVYFEVKKWSGDVFNAEPDKHSELVWLDANNLPENVIPAVSAALEVWSKGDSYLEHGWELQK